MAHGALDMGPLLDIWQGTDPKMGRQRVRQSMAVGNSQHLCFSLRKLNETHSQRSKNLSLKTKYALAG